MFKPISHVVEIEDLHGWSDSSSKDFTLGTKTKKSTFGGDLFQKTVCSQPFTRVTVLYNGDVTPCCVDWTHKLVAGNISGNSDVTNMAYDDGQTPPSEAEIDAEIIRLSAEYDANQILLAAEYEAQTYARNRKAEYDALNQFELMSDDAINGTTTHKDAIVAIKTKYPKG